MMRIICDRWSGNFECENEIASGSRYFIIHFSDESGNNRLPWLYGKHHLCRNCMRVAVKELIEREDFNALDIRTNRL